MVASRQNLETGINWSVRHVPQIAVWYEMVKTEEILQE